MEMLLPPDFKEFLSILKDKKVKYLLKEQGMTINGVKKLLNSKSLKLDEFSNSFISPDNIRIKKKLKNISNLVKQIKRLK